LHPDSKIASLQGLPAEAVNWNLKELHFCFLLAENRDDADQSHLLGDTLVITLLARSQNRCNLL